MGVDANALAGFVEAFVGIDALVVIVDLETFGAKAFEGTDSVAANAVTGARGGALVDICRCNIISENSILFFIIGK